MKFGSAGNNNSRSKEDIERTGAYLIDCAGRVKECLNDILNNSPELKELTQQLASLGVVTMIEAELNVSCVADINFRQPSTEAEIEFQLPSDDEIHEFFRERGSQA